MNNWAVVINNKKISLYSDKATAYKLANALRTSWHTAS